MASKSDETKADRQGRIKWKNYSMGAAILAAQRSNDPSTQVGAVLVDKRNRIIGIGWNGMPTGCRDQDMPWEKTEEPLEDKHSYVCHAEANAFAFKTSNTDDNDSVTLYTTLSPCLGCAKLIAQYGIKEVIYLSDTKKDKPDFQDAKKLMEKKDVEHRNFKVDQRDKTVTLDFTFMDMVEKTSDGEPAEKPKYVTPQVHRKSHERPGRISWEDYFMGMAILASKQSNNSEIQEGAVLVDMQNRIAGIGWNGLPADLEYSSQSQEAKGEDTFDTHAQANAIIFKTSSDIRGAKLYTTLFPCNECTKLIIQSGVAEVHYLSDRKADDKKYKASREMFDKKGDLKVKLVEYKLGELRRTTPLILDYDYLEKKAEATSHSSEAKPMDENIASSSNGEGN